MNAINLAGITPTTRGYDVAPHLAPLTLRLRGLGLAVSPGCVRGYLRPERAGRLVIRVRRPAGWRAGPVTTWVDGRRAPSRAAGGTVSFALAARAAGRAVDWAVARAGHCG